MESHEKVAAGLILTAMMLTAGLLTYVWANSEPVNSDSGGGMLSTFSSKRQLTEFLSSSSRSGIGYNTSYDGARWALDGEASMSPSYSKTNVQVAGIDEMDMVKTDGQFIYIASYDSVNIINAYPPAELSNVSVINESYILGHDDQNVYISFSGLFVLPQKLIVIGTWYDYQDSYWYYNSSYKLEDVGDRGFAPPAYDYGPKSYAFVFDMSTPSAPELELMMGVSGYVQTARMIEDRIYLIAQQYQWMALDETVLPRTWVNGYSSALDLSSIYYDPEMRDPSSFLNVFALDVSSHSHESISVVAGYASTIYMSHEAIFLTVQKWHGDIIVMEDGLAVEDFNTIKTSIFKLAFDGLSMKAVARGDVEGWLLNQFSMDEKDGYLRVATTNMWFQPAEGSDMSSGVFVLNGTLDVVGALKGIAPTERIYSVRFVDDTLYLVTFRQVDPLFVIDLSQPTDPEIVGELEMPGFSNYLHPVDEDHILGVGSENGKVKVSLYDVSDPSAPFEQSKFILDEYDYSYSDAQYDHKAVLFDLEKGILVIPISAYQTGYWYSNTNYVVGALVLKVSVDDGVSLKGIVVHRADYQHQYYNEYVFRSLYIGDALYTISTTTVKASKLSDLSEINSLIYRTYEYYYYYYAL